MKQKQKQNIVLPPNDFIIQNFEKNYPEIVKLISDWTKESIKRNLDHIVFPLTPSVYPNCPNEGEYDKERQVNKRWDFFNKLRDRIADYLIAKGYKEIRTSYPENLLGINKKGWHSGHILRAYPFKRINS